MPEPRRQIILGYFEERFGIPLAVFADYRLVERAKTYAILRESPHVEAVATLQVHTVGVTVLRKVRQHLKPTTVVLQHFGHQATRHIVTLTTSQLETLLQHHAFALTLAIQPGYVILRYQSHILGCGLYLPGCLRSQLPFRQLRSSTRGHFDNA